MTASLVPPRPDARRGRVTLLLPREHGAYGQILFPIATALVLARGAVAAGALSVACVAAFAGHESLLVLLGQRGPRARRERRGAALAWLAGCGAVTTAAGGTGVLAMSGGRASVAIPVVLALALVPLIARQQEHSTKGELLAAAALSSCSVPIAIAGHVSAGRAFVCWVVFALAFTVATVAVRSVIARIKNGAGPFAPWLAGGVIALAMVLAALGVTGWAAAVALLPVCALALALSLFPPHPRHLRTVGWSLVSATAVTAIVLALST